MEVELKNKYKIGDVLFVISKPNSPNYNKIEIGEEFIIDEAFLGSANSQYLLRREKSLREHSDECFFEKHFELKKQIPLVYDTDKGWNF